MGSSDVTAIILAGGRSSRMGRDKALLPFGREPLIAHIVGALRPLFDAVIVVAAADQALPPLPATVVHDDLAFHGPVAGLCYGLRAAHGEWAFVTSCDSAFIRPALVADLVARRQGYDAVVPQWRGRLQPLCAVYRRSLLGLLESRLAEGELRLIDVLDQCRTLTVEEEEVRRTDPDGSSFFNMNTPEDYAEALRRWSAARG